MKFFVIVVKQRDVIIPRLYKTEAKEKPHIDRLCHLGADIWIPREDRVHIEEVSETLYDAFPARWLR